MSVPAALKFTYEDYCLLPEDQRYEVVDGELLLTPAPTTLHQLAKRRLVRILEDFGESTGLGSILDAPYDVVLSRYDVLQPDVLFVTTARKQVIGEKNIQGAPDLVVEVLSPSTEERDRVAKAKRYALFGVREMWLADPDAKTIEVFVNSAEGFRRTALYGEADTARSATVLPGLGFPVAPVFRPL
jgi:Uma2 family endonuclease